VIATSHLLTIRIAFGQMSASNQAVNPFANAATKNVTINPFAAAQSTPSASTPAPVSNPFSGQVKPSNPFAANSTTTSNSQPFGSIASSARAASPFNGTPFQTITNGPSTTAAKPTWPSVTSTTGKRKGDAPEPGEAKFSRSSPDPQIASNRHTSAVRGGRGGRGQNGSARPQQLRAPVRPPTDTDSDLAVKVHAALAKDNIRPPPWPANPGSGEQRKAAENFREAYNIYREKARKCLIKANLIDDPDKRRALSDALEFKGICEDMCPDWERITRIVQHDVKKEEREDIAGENQANIELMITRHARSSAGQDAPLPMDVRSPGALRRTLKYMIDELIPEDHMLPSRHNFLWDRTRAIRKDFIYQEYAMGPDEMRDYIYCLETIARFHVTALHLLTQPEFAGKDFSAQQENEQLEKTLISLMQAYDDCAKQGIACEHEADFRSYYIIVMADNPAWMDVVQSFAARFWNDSDSIRTASILVETLKNIWDMQGPLMPPGTSEMALPVISAFFDIISSPSISYTMACFAEIHFPKVRRLMLKILREAYWRPKAGPTDLTPAVIRQQLRLDSEEEAVEFAKSQGFTFGVTNGQVYAVNNARQPLSEDKPPRMFSQSLVERKRGNHTLAEVIYTTYYENPSSSTPATAEHDSLFVDGSSDLHPHVESPSLKHFNTTPSDSGARSPFALPSPAAQASQCNLTPPSTSSTFNGTGGTALTQSGSFPSIPTTTTPQPASSGTTVNHANLFANTGSSASPFLPQQTNAGAPPAMGLSSNNSVFAVDSPKSIQATSTSKPDVLGSLSSQSPLPTPTSTISKTPGHSVLPGLGQSGTSGFVFPGSKPAKSPKAMSLFPPAPQVTSNASSVTFSAFPTTAPVGSVQTVAGPSPTPATTGVTETTTTSAIKLTSKESELSPPSTVQAPSIQHKETGSTHVQATRDPMDLLTRWYVCADRGLLEEHLEQWMLESILVDTWNRFEEAEIEKVRKEEDDRSWAEARKFREYSLGVTYFYRWLDNFRKRRAVKRIQFEKEKAREWNSPDNRAKRAAAARAAKEKKLQESRKVLSNKTLPPQVMSNQRSSPSVTGIERRPRRDSLEEALLVLPSDSTATRNGSQRQAPMEESQKSDNDEPLQGEKNLLRFENQRRKKRGLQPLRRIPEPKTYKEGSKSAMLKALSSGTGRDTMSLSTASMRNSTFSSSYRSSLGFNASRIAKPTSRVSDPYWRLKANGLVQMPNGEYLHESLALPMLEDGRRFPGIGDYGISRSSRASLSQSDAASIGIPEFSPPPLVVHDEHELDLSTRRRSQVSMSPAAANTSRYSKLEYLRSRSAQHRPGSPSLSRDRKRGYDHVEDDGEAHELSRYVRNHDETGREGSLSRSGGSLHKRARSSVRGVGAAATGTSSTAAKTAAVDDAQSTASISGDTDFLASIDRLLRDVQDAGRSLS